MKYIIAPQISVEELVKEFQEEISKLGRGVDRISFTKTLNKPDYPKAKIEVTPEAHAKMTTLTALCQKEIGWHMIVDKLDTGIYRISDVVVYPQTVTGVTVTTDDVDYTSWLYKFDDETFNKIRGQGHSHVNMGTFASATDEAYMTQVLQQIDDYYVFLIMNKKGELYTRVYDFVDNVYYENGDSEYLIMLEDNIPTKEWYQSVTNGVVKEVVVTTPSTPSTAYGYYNNKTYAERNAEYKRQQTETSWEKYQTGW